MTTATDTHTPSRACYLRGCRAPECELANYRYSKQLRHEHQRGERRLHDVTQVRAHIEQLLANKWWQAEIARVAGVPSSNVTKILAGQRHTSKRDALAILSIPIAPPLRNAQGDRADATGSTRRLRALAWLGHSWVDISNYTDMTQDRLSYIACGHADVVRPEEAQKIAAAYRVLATRSGRMKQIATAARNKGWHGPLAWDRIDDPDSKPETEHRASRARASSKPKVYADVARVAELTAAGKTAREIADELGCHKRTVVRARGRADLAVAA